jgi:hypothetical protein
MRNFVIDVCELKNKNVCILFARTESLSKYIMLKSLLEHHYGKNRT